MSEITKEHAERIATKLGAIDETKKGDEHDEMVIYHEGQYVASFGIRRGSKKDAGHGHVPKNLGVNTHFAKELAICTKSRLEYLEKVGIIKCPPPSETFVLPPPRHWEKDWVKEQEAEAQKAAEESAPDDDGESSI